MLVLLKSFAADDAGATAIEYGMLAAFIAIALLAGFALVGGSVQQLFDNGSAEVIARQTALIP
ncbi:MAG TPA: Flp family type IVb pilin [Devosia sp.]|jgi:pilus assembly protein Flp/PilA|uniref:Flp family type IVb pilin n=1 Tax=Devosia sp. TaxID=1871048 RepID=UPI002F91EA50